MVIRLGKMTKSGWRILLPLGLCAALGCKSTQPHGGGRNDDPLLGGPASGTAIGQPVALTSNNNSSPASLGAPNYPPLTQATPTSTAVLASGAYPPLVGGRDLRIGQAPSNAGGNRILPPSQNPPGVVAVVTANPDANNGSPSVIPLDASGNRPANQQPAVVPVATPVSTVPAGLEQGMSVLNQYGPKWHRLDNVGDGVWRFSCAIPDRAEPTKSRVFEAEGPTGPAALQQVLDRIRNER